MKKQRCSIAMCERESVAKLRNIYGKGRLLCVQCHRAYTLGNVCGRKSKTRGMIK